MNKSMCRTTLAPSLVALACMSAAACDEFATPAELAKPQILAIRADPPAVAPGGSAEMTILVADADGPIAAPDVTWQVAESSPGVAPLGSVEPASPGTATYRGPATAPSGTPVDIVSATVRVADTELTALKGVLIAEVPLVNPTITAVTVDDQNVLDREQLALSRGQVVQVGVDTDPPASDDHLFAWYSTKGEITFFQSNPAELVVSEEAGEGWLIVVVRDGGLGVAWHALPIIVE